MKKLLTKKGFTLIELVIAVAVLAMTAGALFGTFSFGLTQSFRASRYHAASIEAQLQMERLVGRRWDGDLENIPWVAGAGDVAGVWDPIPANLSSCGGFTVVISYSYRRTNWRNEVVPPDNSHPLFGEPDAILPFGGPLLPDGDLRITSPEEPVLISVSVELFCHVLGDVTPIMTHQNILNVRGTLTS
jgi:prepilin-type N-terminal cleavage/methylation domain-containing protein